MAGVLAAAALFLSLDSVRFVLIVSFKVLPALLDLESDDGDHYVRTFSQY